MKAAFKPGVLVRAKRVRSASVALTEAATIVRYDGEGFYVVEVERRGERRAIVAHEDDLTLPCEACDALTVDALRRRFAVDAFYRCECGSTYQAPQGVTS